MMSNLGKPLDPINQQQANAKALQKSCLTNSSVKFDNNMSQYSRIQTKRSHKKSEDSLDEYRLHLRDPQTFANKKADTSYPSSLADHLASNLAHLQSTQDNLSPNTKYKHSSHQRKKSIITDSYPDVSRFKNPDSSIMLDHFPSIKEALFAQFSNDNNDTANHSLPRYFQISNTQTEMNDLIAMIEQRFLKIEARVETNESLIHLYDEMQRLKNQESHKSIAQEEYFINQVNARLGVLEAKIKALEETAQVQRVDMDLKLNEFMKKIDTHLEKFVENTLQLAKKVEVFQKDGDSDIKQREERMNSIDSKVSKLTEEIREKLKAICDTVGDVGKLSEKTSKSLSDEKDIIKKLEEDFFKLITTCKESNEHVENYKWISEEISYLKFKQTQILDHIKSSGHNISVSTSSFI